MIKRNEHTRKKSETNSPEVSDELLSNNVKIFCQASDLEKGSCDASNTLWSSPDFILESFFQV